MVSLCNKYLATHRTSAAGGDYVKVYELETGRLTATHDVTGGFGMVTFIERESVTRLVAVDKDLTVKVFMSKTGAHQAKVTFQLLLRTPSGFTINLNVLRLCGHNAI